MPHPSKRKGDTAEREIAALLRNHLGLDIRRALGAGRTDDIGDLHGLPNCAAQVKNYIDPARAIREGLADIERQQTNAGATHGVVFIRRPGGNWIAVQTISQWCAMYRETLQPAAEVGLVGKLLNEVVPGLDQQFTAAVLAGEVPDLLNASQASRLIDALYDAKKGKWPDGWVPQGKPIPTDGTEPF